MPLHSIRIQGFKSIRDQTLELSPLNVFIGGKGAGKSNLIGVFHFLNRIYKQELALFKGLSGDANRILHFGRSRTEKLSIEVVLTEGIGKNIYEFSLRPTDEDGFVFEQEAISVWDTPQYDRPYLGDSWSGHTEGRLAASETRTARHVKNYLESYRTYHFHNTSSSAPSKQTGDVEDNRFLRPDGGNLAAFLYWLQKKQPDHYRNIEDTINQIAPFFRGFNLAPTSLNPEKIRLEWEEYGSDAYFGASALSNGTLRFICLATLLLQPDLPPVVSIDEPELRLHPAAIQVLAGLLQSASTRVQLLVATQSVTLINQLEPEQVWVVDKEFGESHFKHLKDEDMSAGLEDYGLGELWEKNLFGGRPLTKRVLILAEGQTEERFVKDVLNPHFTQMGIYLIPTLATTKRVRNGPDFKGGITNYRKVATDIRLLLGDMDATAVTTFIDYYGLPSDFPGMTTRPSGNSFDRADHVETAWKVQVADLRFNPFLMIHEFEAILFSKPDEISSALHDVGAISQLNQIRASFSSPEEINDSPTSAPSKRLMKILPGYSKIVNGPVVAERIGLPTIRNECIYFSEWVGWLERL